MLLRTAAVVLAALVLPTSVRAADVVTLAGKRVTGSLSGVTPQVVTLLDPAGVPVRIPTAEVSAVEFGKPAPAGTGKYDELELVDGSVLRTTQFTVKDKAVGLAPLAPGVAVELPLGAVYWLLRGADDAANRAAWQVLVAGRGKRDLFVIRQAAGLNPLPGTVLAGTAAGDAVEFEREDGAKVSLRLVRASGGIVFNQPPRDVVPATVCRVVDRAGNRLVAQSVTVAGAGLEVTTVAGAVVKYATLDAVEKLDFAQGNVRYLSDLAGKADYPPPETDGPLGALFPFAPRVVKDKAVGGGPITLSGRAFARGLSVPPDVSVAYPLGADFREFRATVGVQDGSNRLAWAMRLRLELDGRAVFDEVIKKTDPPRDLAVNVKGARELRVTVTRAGSAIDGDQLNLGDARVQK